MTRKQRILLALLGILALALLYGILSYPRQKRVSDSVPPPAERPRPAPAGTITPAEHEGRRLPEVAEEVPTEAEDGVTRNIFAPLYPYVPPPRPEIARPQNGPVQQAPAPPPLRLIGSLEKDGRRLFFFSQAQELYIVHREEPFGVDNRFRVVDAEDDEVLVESTDDGEMIHLPVSRTVSSVEKVGVPAGVFRRPTYRPAPAVDFPVPEPSVATEEDLPPEGAPGPVDSGSLNEEDDDVSEGGPGAGNGAAAPLPVEEVRDE
jgi:hypothetical protein